MAETDAAKVIWQSAEPWYAKFLPAIAAFVGTNPMTFITLLLVGFNIFQLSTLQQKTISEMRAAYESMESRYSIAAIRRDNAIEKMATAAERNNDLLLRLVNK